MPTANSNILLFDGVCNLCNKSVQFVIKRDKKAIIKFASLQSDVGKLLLKEAPHLAYDLNTVVYLKNDKLYMKSSAILHLLKDIGGAWKLMGIFFIVPRFIRDAAYNVVAKYRYRLFGAETSCIKYDDDLSERFL